MLKKVFHVATSPKSDGKESHSPFRHIGSDKKTAKAASCNVRSDTVPDALKSGSFSESSTTAVSGRSDQPHSPLVHEQPSRRSATRRGTKGVSEAVKEASSGCWRLPWRQCRVTLCPYCHRPVGRAAAGGAEASLASREHEHEPDAARPEDYVSCSASIDASDMDSDDDCAAVCRCQRGADQQAQLSNDGSSAGDAQPVVFMVQSHGELRIPGAIASEFTDSDDDGEQPLAHSHGSSRHAHLSLVSPLKATHLHSLAAPRQPASGAGVDDWLAGQTAAA